MGSQKKPEKVAERTGGRHDLLYIGGRKSDVRRGKLCMEEYLKDGKRRETGTLGKNAFSGGKGKRKGSRSGWNTKAKKRSKMEDFICSNTGGREFPKQRRTKKVIEALLTEEGGSGEERWLEKTEDHISWRKKK